MDGNVVQTRLPGQHELSARLAELILLQDRLADRELELATLEATLHEFNQRYLKMAGPKYAELDRIEAEIAERLAARDPANKERGQEATEARQRASETAAATGKFSQATAPGPRSETLKKLYREAARKMHPDYADDSHNRKLRESYMTKINGAYGGGDEKAIRELLDEWDNNPEAVEGIGPEADLERTARRVFQLKKRISEIDALRKGLMASELFQLYVKFGQEDKIGRDPLQALAKSINVRIKYAQERLEQLATEDAG